MKLIAVVRFKQWQALVIFLSSMHATRSIENPMAFHWIFFFLQSNLLFWMSIFAADQKLYRHWQYELRVNIYKFQFCLEIICWSRSLSSPFFSLNLILMILRFYSNYKSISYTNVIVAISAFRTHIIHLICARLLTQMHARRIRLNNKIK